MEDGAETIVELPPQKKQPLSLNQTSVKAIVRKCRCSLSRDALVDLIDVVKYITEYIVRQERIYKVPPELCEFIGDSRVTLTKSYMNTLLGSLNVIKSDRQRYIDSVSSALTIAVCNACAATSKLRPGSKTPIVPKEVLHNFLVCFM